MWYGQADGSIFFKWAFILFQNELPGVSAFYSLDSGLLPRKVELDWMETTSHLTRNPDLGGLQATSSALSQHVDKDLQVDKMFKHNS